jgi:alkyl hydroperoxide reductase subunit AhpC
VCDKLTLLYLLNKYFESGIARVIQSEHFLQGQMKVVELAKYKGSSAVILLFYPAHFDLGLTSQLDQLTSLRDQLPPGTAVMAVTTDNVEAAQVWAERDTAKEGLRGYDVMLLR